MSIDTARVPTRSSVRATATWVFWMNLYMAGWFWLMATIVITAALVVINVVGEVNTSVVAFARQGAIWFPFSVLIAITAAYLPVHVAAGLTRRSLSFGSLIGATGTALVYGGAFAGLLLLERAVFSAFGWQWRILDDITYTSSGVGPVIVSTTLIFVVAYVSGLLVGMSYQRLGGWFGRSPCRSPPVPSCWSSPCSRRTPAPSPPPRCSAATSRSSSPPRRPC